MASKWWTNLAQQGLLLWQKLDGSKQACFHFVLATAGGPAVQVMGQLSCFGPTTWSEGHWPAANKPCVGRSIVSLLRKLTCVGPTLGLLAPYQGFGAGFEVKSGPILRKLKDKTKIKRRLGPKIDRI